MIYIIIFERVLAIISFILTFILLYQLILAPLAFKKPKTPKKTAPQNRFALVVSARNEKAVIGHLLDSLNSLDYPRELYDVFVIADNCTDNTAEIAADKGAIVYVRDDRTLIGKGYALNWFYNIFRQKHISDYDASGIFDADNLVDPSFLRVMNDYLASGEVAVMGYRDSKNPYDNWISGCTSMVWWNLTRFYHIPREKLGLSALAGGTGYVFRTSVIENGWNTGSICEDTEFSMQLMAKKMRLAFAYNAKFYDEQPTDMTTSLRQRYRWAVGSMQCAGSCSKPLLKSVLRGNFPTGLDGFLFLMTTPVFGIQIIFSLLRLFLIFFQPEAVWAEQLSSYLFFAAAGGAACLVHGIILLVFERKPLRKMVKTLLMYPVFLLSAGVINIIVLFYRNPVWHPIQHKKSVSLSKIA